MGADRTVLVVLCDAYDEEEVEGETRVVLRFHPAHRADQGGGLPAGEEGRAAGDGAADLRRRCAASFRTFYDESGVIGRRYRRQDEVGTPFCVTVDYQTKEDETVTIRYRDTMEQDRVDAGRIADYLQERIAP